MSRLVETLKLLLAESVDPVEAVERAIDRFLRDKERSAEDGSSVIRWKVGGLTVVVLERKDGENKGVLQVVSPKELSSPGVKWECGIRIRVYPGKKEDGCRTLVDESSFKGIVRALPKIIRDFSSQARASLKDIQDKEPLVREAYQKVKDYLESVAKEIGGKVKGEINGLKAKVVIERKIYPDQDFTTPELKVVISPSSTDLVFELPFSGKTRVFNMEPLKRGAKRLVRLFPSIRKVLYLGKSKGSYTVPVIIFWNDPKRMPDDLVGVLKEIRR